MQIHRIRGRDLNDALHKARAAHGDDAVVLSHESGADGGVTVSVTDDDKRTRPRVERTEEPGERDVRSRMRAAGASDELTELVVDAVRNGDAHGAFAIDKAAEVIAERMRVAPSPPAPDGVRAIAFVGPTGSGKTATVAKLAERLTRAGRRVAVATLDGYRRGGVDVLAGEASRLDVPFLPCRYRQDLATLLATHADVDAILLDTRGRSPRDGEHLAQLAEVLEGGLPGADLLTYLVVPATTSAEALAEVRAGFAGTKPSAAVVTKVDETRRTAVAIEAMLAADLPIAFLCNGQEVTTDFLRATPDRMADLILGGRVR